MKFKKLTLNELSEKFEDYVVSIMAGKRQRLRDHFFRGFLFVLSRLFRGIVQSRLMLYNERIFRQHLQGCQIISVGNLTVGGTGKTPVVEFLTKTLLGRGRNVAIVSRGYRSKKKPFLEKMSDKWHGKKEVPRIVSDGKEVLLDAEMGGDEPHMLAKNLLPAVVLVNKNRVMSCSYATRNFASDIIILDDGFQYLRLRPSYNICLVDSTNPFDNHHVLPRGLLREPIKNIKRANLIFLTKASQRRNLSHLKRFIRKHNRDAKIIECAHKPVRLTNVYDKNDTKTLDFLEGKDVASLSGIAVPTGFENSLGRLGANLIYKERFADHHKFRDEEIQDCFDSSLKAGAEMIITTEKDAVRIPDLGEQKLPIYYLKIEIGIFHGSEYFDEFISKVLLEPKDI